MNDPRLRYGTLLKSQPLQSAAPLSKTLIHEFEHRMIPSLRGNTMLRASARLFQSSERMAIQILRSPPTENRSTEYVKMHAVELFERLNNPKGVFESCGEANDERECERSLQRLEALEGIVPFDEAKEGAFYVAVERLLEDHLQSTQATRFFKEILGTFMKYDFIPKLM